MKNNNYTAIARIVALKIYKRLLNWVGECIFFLIGTYNWWRFWPRYTIGSALLSIFLAIEAMLQESHKMIFCTRMLKHKWKIVYSLLIRRCELREIPPFAPILIIVGLQTTGISNMIPGRVHTEIIPFQLSIQFY